MRNQSFWGSGVSMVARLKIFASVDLRMIASLRLLAVVAWSCTISLAVPDVRLWVCFAPCAFRVVVCCNARDVRFWSHVA